jgi:hypothetical protein
MGDFAEVLDDLGDLVLLIWRLKRALNSFRLTGCAIARFHTDCVHMFCADNWYSVCCLYYELVKVGITLLNHLVDLATAVAMLLIRGRGLSLGDIDVQLLCAFFRTEVRLVQKAF